MFIVKWLLDKKVESVGKENYSQDKKFITDTSNRIAQLVITFIKKLMVFVGDQNK